MVFPSSLKLPYDAAFIEGDPDLSFISNNTTRVVSNRDAAPLEAWTVISTRKFGSDNKVCAHSHMRTTGPGTGAESQSCADCAVNALPVTFTWAHRTQACLAFGWVSILWRVTVRMTCDKRGEGSLRCTYRPTGRKHALPY